MQLARATCFAVTCVALASGQSKPDQKPAERTQAAPQPARPAAASGAKTANGKIEGIQVHGHWVLEIRNRDGSVAQRKEFENSLATGTGNGGALLATLLAGSASVGPWLVLFSNNGNAALGITESAALGCAFPCSSSLTVSSSAGQLVLQGATPLAAAPTTINSVSTIMSLCPSTISVQACIQLPTGVPGDYLLTSYTLPGTGVTVQAGQDIAVTVTISFSS
jgi:hypothetical protein